MTLQLREFNKQVSRQAEENVSICKQSIKVGQKPEKKFQDILS